MAVEVHNDGGGSSGGNTMLAFLLGIVLVAVAVIGFFMWDNYKSHTGGGASGGPSINLTVHKSGG